MVIFKLFYQLFAMAAPILLIGAAIVVAKFGGPLVGLGAFLLIYWSRNDDGGLFFAWKPANIKAFWRNFP